MEEILKPSSPLYSFVLTHAGCVEAADEADEAASVLAAARAAPSVAVATSLKTMSTPIVEGKGSLPNARHESAGEDEECFGSPKR